MMENIAFEQKLIFFSRSAMKFKQKSKKYSKLLSLFFVVPMRAWQNSRFWYIICVYE